MVIRVGGGWVTGRNAKRCKRELRPDHDRRAGFCSSGVILPEQFFAVMTGRASWQWITEGRTG